MTKQHAVDKLVKLYYPEGEKFRDFFVKIVEEKTGEGNFVSESLYEDIVSYLSTFT